MRALRLLTTPGRVANALKIRNSVTVRVTASAFHVQMCRSGSIRSWPRSNALGVGFLGIDGVLGGDPVQHHFDALDQQARRKRFADEIVGPHPEPEQLVDFLFLGG